MARIPCTVEFHTWGAPGRPVFRVERAGKFYRASCYLRSQGANHFSDHWKVRVRGKNGMYRRSALSDDGPTHKAIVSHVICSAAWHMTVNGRSRAEAAKIEAD